MKLLHLFLLLLCGFTTSVQAQDFDDDMYFVSNKKKAAKSKVKAQQDYANSAVMRRTVSAVNDSEADADYHTGQLRDVDDYNRRNNIISNGQVVAKLQNDTLYVYSNDSTKQQTYVYGSDNEVNSSYYDDSYYYNDDYVFTSRLGRYHSVHFVDPWYWDYCYGWYDPWYNPWYGWYTPYYPTWSYSWCSPIYHHHVYPGIVGGHHPGHISHHNSGRHIGSLASRTHNRMLNSRNSSVNERNTLSSRNRMTNRQDGNNSERTLNNRSSRITSSRDNNTSSRNERSSSRIENSSRSSSTTSRSSSTSGSMSTGSRGGGFGGSRGGGFSSGGSSSRGGGFSGGSRGGRR